MFNEFVLAQKACFPAGLHTELRAQLNRQRGIALVNGSLTSNTRRDESGVSARVYKNGVYGFASMAEVSVEAARAVINAAGENAEFLDRQVNKGKVELAFAKQGAFRAPREGADVEQKRYIDFARQLDEYIQAHCKSLSARTVVMRADSMEKSLAVSDGTDAFTRIPRCYSYLFLNAEAEDGAPIELFKALGGFGGFEENFSDPALLYPEIDALYERLMQKRSAVYAKAGVNTVVLGGDLCGMLAHEAVGHTVEADLVNGGSVAGPMLNKRVASDLVSLTDFAHHALGNITPLPVYVDDEGTPCEDAPIIVDGMLVEYMNSRETARQFGMTPRGNARAFCFSDEPLIRMRNTAVLPGKSTLDDIIASVDDGYYLVDTNNGQADTTGEFMFGVSMGYEIKNGKIGRAIRDTTISGVAFEMLKSVDMVSNNMNWSSSGFCGKKQPMPVGMGGPEIRCKVMIGGK